MDIRTFAPFLNSEKFYSFALFNNVVYMISHLSRTMWYISYLFMQVPVYIAEISPQNLRGALGSVNQVIQCCMFLVDIRAVLVYFLVFLILQYFSLYYSCLLQLVSCYHICWGSLFRGEYLLFQVTFQPILLLALCCSCTILW